MGAATGRVDAAAVAAPIEARWLRSSATEPGADLKKNSPMSSISSRFVAVGQVPVPAAAVPNLFQARLTALYTLSQQNRHVFASPLGPFHHAGRTASLPRFAFFGPHASDDSWRLAFLAGFDSRDLRASHALLQLIERLAEHAEEGHGLNLAFFPLVAAGAFFLEAPERALDRAHWGYSAAPEIDLLEKDARLCGYHGFVRVETAPPGEDLISVRLRDPLRENPSPDIELISTAETKPFPARFERVPRSAAVFDGPLTIADDLPIRPFELTLQIPDRWSDKLYLEAVSTILLRFILRYRAFQAYGLHL
jgi:hypothetical protein